MKPRILVISFLFPNCVYPTRGVFVLNRLKAVQEYADVKVINPILWFPFNARLSRYKDYDKIPRTETIDGIEVFHPRFLSIPVVFKSLLAVTYTLAVLPLALRLRRRWRYELIDLHWTYPDLPAGRWLAWLLKLKQLVTVRGTPALFLGERSLQSALVRRQLRQSDQVICLSDELKQHCLEYGVAEERVVTIRNGVDGTRFPYLDQRECRAKLGLPADAWLVLGTGYFTPRKGFDRIIQALPEVRRARPNAKLYLIGQDGTFAQGDRTQELRQQARELGLDEHVIFVGEVANEELALWYNAADCFCLSSRSEGCPNVLLEALACGCPVVATDVGAVKEVVNSPALGVVVPNSSEGVQQGLLQLLAGQYDRKAISAELQQYDWPWCAGQVKEVYERLLGRQLGVGQPGPSVLVP